MSIQKNALLVTEVSTAFEGWRFKCTSIPMTVPESEVCPDRVFDSNGDLLTVETIQSESGLGDSQRIEEEAFQQSLLYVTSEECLSPPTAPFWLFPIPSVDVDFCKCRIIVEGFSLFKTAGFQMASWSRYVWGNIFFDDPTTLKEHAAKAVARSLKVGDAIPIRINGSVSGVAVLDGQLARNEFDATIFVVGKINLENGSTLETECFMTVEGITALFKSKLGVVADVHTTCSN